MVNDLITNVTREAWDLRVDKPQMSVVSSSESAWQSVQLQGATRPYHDTLSSLKGWLGNACPRVSSAATAT
jgi:hypothetical protein